MAYAECIKHDVKRTSPKSLMFLVCFINTVHCVFRIYVYTNKVIGKCY